MQYANQFAPQPPAADRVMLAQGGVFTNLDPSVIPALDGVRGGYGAVLPMAKFFRKQGVVDGQTVFIEMVNLYTPGDNKAVVTSKVTDRHRQMFGPTYQHWKQSNEFAIEGTDLSLWSALTEDLIHTLKANNIFTIEQLAGCPDNLVGNFPMGKTLKLRAQEFLDYRDKEQSLAAHRREKQDLENTVTMMNAQMEAMTRQMKEMEAKLSAATASSNADAEPKARSASK